MKFLFNTTFPPINFNFFWGSLLSLERVFKIINSLVSINFLLSYKISNLSIDEGNSWAKIVSEIKKKPTQIHKNVQKISILSYMMSAVADGCSIKLFIKYF